MTTTNSAPELYQVTDTIAAGTALGAGFQINDMHLMGIIMPAAWTAAGLSFGGSYTGSGYLPMQDQFGAEMTVPAAANKYIVFPPGYLSGINWLQVRSGTFAAPVNQAAAATLTFLVRRYN